MKKNLAFSSIERKKEMKTCKSEETVENEESGFQIGCDEDYIRGLLEREATSGGRLQLPGIPHPSWIVAARLDGIHYILRTRERLGLTFKTAYASVTYLDRFLSRRSIDGEKYWAVRLLSLVCLSLAAKMEKITVPALSAFCSEDYSFEGAVIQRMELLVLNTLEWKLGVVSPFAFIDFFTSKLLDIAVSRIGEVIVGTMKDMNIMCHKPSVVAAAAAFAASDHEFTREALQLKISSLTSSLPLQTDDIISCYYQIQKLDIGILDTSKGIMSPDLSPAQLHRGEFRGSSSAGKRKRLVFNQDDEKADKKGKP